MGDRVVSNYTVNSPVTKFSVAVILNAGFKYLLKTLISFEYFL